MQIHATIASLRAARAALGRVALVPTMGNLHAGHIALMHQARAHADATIATVFVNRLQFRPGEDFDRYPRSFAADCAQLEAAGVDHLFAPDEAEMYPTAQTCHIEPDPALANVLEGEFRPGHFRGVATVVMKLFQIAQPQVAVFGKKDYQQWLVIRQMVAQLNLPIEIIGSETQRATDGLALSSRNGYLSAAERQEAPRLSRILKSLVESVKNDRSGLVSREKHAFSELQAHGWLPDYVVLRRMRDLLPPSTHDTELVVLAAARLGATRLIDNMEVHI